MKASKKSKKRNEHTSLVTDIDQAVFIFRTLFTDYKADTLTDGILLWLSKMDNSLSLRIFLSLPELMEEEYSFDDFLKGSVDLPEVSDKQNIRIVGIAASLLSLITSCWTLFGKKIHKNPACAWPYSNSQGTDSEIIKAVLDRISLNDIQQELAMSLMSIIGRQYYDLFIGKLRPFDNKMSIQEVKAFENDPELKVHMQLTLWSVMMRCFLDAVYFYFGRENNPTT